MIKSFLGTSLIEYPGKISSVIFIGGCNLRCPYCHNLDLVLPELVNKTPDIPEDDIIKELIKRKGFIDGLAITGGEPLLPAGILPFIKRVKDEVGLEVKIDTNGTFPGKLKEVLPHVDYISMDIKTSPEKYPLATGGKAKFKDVEASIEIIKSAEYYEFRTTMVPNVVDKEDLRQICETIKPVKKYALQRFRPQKTLSPEFSEISPYPKNYLEEASEYLDGCAGSYDIRV